MSHMQGMMRDTHFVCIDTVLHIDYVLLLLLSLIPECYCVAKGGSCFLSWGSGGGGLFARRFVFSLIASSGCLWEKREEVMSCDV